MSVVAVFFQEDRLAMQCRLDSCISSDQGGDGFLSLFRKGLYRDICYIFKF